jgi:hypothetical protein
MASTPGFYFLRAKLQKAKHIKPESAVWVGFFLWLCGIWALSVEGPRQGILIMGWVLWAGLGEVFFPLYYSKTIQLFTSNCLYKSMKVINFLHNLYKNK